MRISKMLFVTKKEEPADAGAIGGTGSGEFIALLVAVIVLTSCSGEGSMDLPVTPPGGRGDSAHRIGISLDGSLQNPAFSPDGKALVFTRFRDGYNLGASDLFIYDLESGELSALMVDGHGNVNLPGAVWHGGLGEIVFSSDRDPHDEVFVIDAVASTGSEVQVTERVGKQSFEPSFSPDGHWTVFESHDVDVEDDGIITKVRLDGTSEYVDLTASGDDCRQPNWSPSGDLILYQRQVGGQWDIWAMRVDGSGKRKITSDEGNETDAVFSYDGAWIVYSSENDEVELANIYRSSVGGGRPIRVTVSDAYDGAPSISPDGRRVAFESSPIAPDESSGTTLWLIEVE